MKKLASLLFLCGTLSVFGQANLTFSYTTQQVTDGTHVEGFFIVGTQLADPLTYVITSPGEGPMFVFQNVGNFHMPGFYQGLNVSPPPVPPDFGNLQFTINGGSLITLHEIYSDAQAGALLPSDAYALASDANFNLIPANLQIGDVITLFPGEIINWQNPGNLFDAERQYPANGIYPTFLVDYAGNQISGPGVVAVPEPATASLVTLGGLGLAGAAWRRRRRG